MYHPRLKDLRKYSDLGQKEIAVFLGRAQRVYNSYETDKCEFPAHFVIKFADFCKTSTDYILRRTNNPKPCEN